MTRAATTHTERNVFAWDAEIAQSEDGNEVEVSGPLSVRTSALVRSNLAEAIDRGEGDLRLNLTGAEIYDATGLGVLMGAHHRATRSGRRLVVAGASPRLARVMRATKLDRVIAQDGPRSLTALAS